ncbi:MULTISPECIES: PhzF family phenazine biosynthesis protein [unclassified Wenzhouxiangella]|uniref:PhzF family phenazine biosynthesis protein n=1 Tax=unclassified Wenzhouxiangella TaxID=2613841 RepID=UPI000E329948|nr:MULTISPECIES: PhzF family phenazine biosynthesis isomerase [unclassified Wenzhouxiangella]RFF27477.1 PhzF family phenazine biosynthesis isomerase [Wenzhouxiangella sp. 15181]RFP69661.1 PhzF family phenazine biosynthesis isomerase [Wenzhouxiangella sp. 15190]
MELKLFQVDAFAEKVFEGNPAAVVPLEEWLDDELLLAIASENNLSETAFFVPENGRYKLRWFTPQAEVDLCGHATLATAHVLFEHLGFSGEEVVFDSRSGELRVRRSEAGLELDFPAGWRREIGIPLGIDQALGSKPRQAFEGEDCMLVFGSEAEIRALSPDFRALVRVPGRGVITTAPGDEVDFVSRCFFPKLRVDEDPVTGSAHCQMAPYWGERLGKDELLARQVSARGGTVRCRVAGERVKLAGPAVDFLVGTIRL